MRSPIGKKAKALFQAEVARRLPEFTCVKGRTGEYDPAWAWTIAPNLTLFFKLIPFPRRDHFTIEIGWNESNDVDIENNYRKRVDTAPEWGDRLPRMWQKKEDGPRENRWEIVPEPTDEQIEAWHAVRPEFGSYLPPDPPVEEVLPRIAPLVQDAVDKLEQYAMPIFRQAAKARGLKWPASRGGTL